MISGKYLQKIGEKGFSLFEVLIVAGILGIISVTIASTFASGLNVFARVQEYGRDQIDNLLALERIEKDIHNTFYFPKIRFAGTFHEFFLPGIYTYYDDEGEQKTSLGRFHYYFDYTRKALMVDWQPYNMAIAGTEDEGSYQEKLASMEDIEVSYLSLDDTSGESFWVDSWADESLLPRGIKFKFILNKEDENQTIVSKIFIPVSKPVSEEGENDQEEELASET